MDLLDYSDYRAYLRDWLRERAGRPSMRTFAVRAGVSVTLVSQILRQQRDLEPRRAPDFGRALDLQDDQVQWFVDLVQVEHGSSLLERRAARDRILARRRIKRAQAITEPMARLLNHWYYPAVAELARCPGFQDDPAWIAAILRPRITEIEALDALETLVDLGVLARGADGALMPVAETWTTGTEVDAAAVGAAAREYHRWALRRASDAIDEFPPPERHVATFTAVVAAGALPEVKELAQRFEAQLLQCCEQNPGDRVYLVSVQLFPVSAATSTPWATEGG
ncbi:MAG: TIGR02147 family protein [Myxococcota bacterium]